MTDVSCTTPGNKDCSCSTMDQLNMIITVMSVSENFYLEPLVCNIMFGLQMNSSLDNMGVGFRAGKNPDTFLVSDISQDIPCSMQSDAERERRFSNHSLLALAAPNK